MGNYRLRLFLIKTTMKMIIEKEMIYENENNKVE